MRCWWRHVSDVAFALAVVLVAVIDILLQFLDDDRIQHYSWFTILKCVDPRMIPETAGGGRRERGEGRY